MRVGKITVLTNCTSRKRRPAMPLLQARNLPMGDVDATSKEWVSRLESAKYQFFASHLYCGRAVTETLAVGNALNAEVAFLSAGLGIVDQFEKIPSYSLAASAGYPDSVNSRITSPYEPADWWSALATAKGARTPLARLIEQRGAGLTLIALPASYLAMIALDLQSLPSDSLRSVRIIGPRRAEDVDPQLRQNWLPYDARLDCPSTGINGTASDFPHRALRHFALTVLPRCPAGNNQIHADAVRDALSGFDVYVRPCGQRRSDDEVTRVIASVWTKHSGRRASILRELRSELNIACEQSRFRKLADQVEKNLNDAA
jgi:hypothetical protein